MAKSITREQTVMKRSLVAVALLLLGAGACQAHKTIRQDTLEGCDAVIVAKLDKAALSSIAYSLPPTYSMLLEFSTEDVLWGPFLEGRAVQAFHSVNQNDEPKYSIGTKCLVGLKHDRTDDYWHVALFEGSKEDNVKEATEAR